MIRFEFIDIIKSLRTWAHGFRTHFDNQVFRITERLRRIENAMATKAQVEELNANLTEALGEINTLLDEQRRQLEEQAENSNADLTQALDISRRLKDIVTNAAPQPAETPEAGEGDDTLEAPEGEDTLGGDNQADHLDGQEQ